VENEVSHKIQVKKSHLVARSTHWFSKEITRLIETRFFTCIVIILIVGTVLRLALIWITTSPMDPLNRLYPGYTDGIPYSNIAHSLIETGVYGYGGRPSAIRPPAYPFMISLIWKSFGENFTAVRMFQVALFAIMAACYIYVTFKYFGKFAAGLTAVVFSVYPLFVFMTTEIATENLYMTLTSIVFALTLMLLHDKEQPDNKPTVAFAAGLCCGAGILTRPNMVFVFLLLQALIIWHAFRSSERLKVCITAFLGLWIGTLLVLSPWLIRNQLQIGSPVLTTNLDYNFFRGTFDLAYGGPTGDSIIPVFREHNVMYEGDIENPKLTHLPLSELENEQNAHAAAISIIRADPLLWLKERGKNLVYLWLNLQWEPELLEKRPLVIVAAVSVTIVYYVLLIAAIVGSVWISKRNTSIEQRAFVAVAWLFILAAMPVVITFVGKRYRVSMIDPYLIIAACAAIGSWFNQFRRSVSWQ
jgi:4-amino-4-deoxy-L-arabinose transferase-like glycosyltransferase